MNQRPSNLFAQSMDWKTILCSGMRMHSFPWLCDFCGQYRMCSAKLRNHLMAINQYLLYFKASHVICYWECLASMVWNRLVQITMAPFFVHLECYVTYTGQKVMASNLLNPRGITNNLLVNNLRRYFQWLLQELYAKQFLCKPLLQ